MKRLLAYVLTALLLLQSFGRELLVLHFQANRAELAARYCRNKARPRLHCNGRCYLARQLRRVERGPAKAPAGALAKARLEGLAPVCLRLALPARASRLPPWRYARLVARTYALVALGGVFQPPARQS